MTELNVSELVARYDPFDGLGFSTLDGRRDHLPPPPTLAEVMAHPIQLDWRHPARCGHRYDIGRFRFFVERYTQGLDVEPITLTQDGSVEDGHHRLCAAYLLGLDRVTAHS